MFADQAKPRVLRWFGHVERPEAWHSINKASKPYVRGVRPKRLLCDGQCEGSIRYKKGLGSKEEWLCMIKINGDAVWAVSTGDPPSINDHFATSDGRHKPPFSIPRLNPSNQ